MAAEPVVLSMVLALASSVFGGIADFGGGLAARRVGTLTFVLYAQVTGAIAAVVWVVASGDSPPGLDAVLAACAAGVALVVTLSAFFHAMVLGSMSIVAAVSATGVAVPIAVGVAQGERPSLAQAVGMAVAVAGILLTSWRPADPDAVAKARASLGYALIAALGVGVYLWLMSPASADGVPWAMLFSRVIPVVAFATLIASRRLPVRLTSIGELGAIVGVGLLAFCSIALYALSTVHGALSVVSVLGSLYPAATVLLAYTMLGERLDPMQQVGIVAVLAGVLVVSLG